jgi:hypothetical protein
MEQRQIPRFQEFCEREFRLRKRLRALRDTRHAPKISAGTVAEAICFMGALGLGSLLQCDQQLRTDLGQHWFGQPHPVVSDTTIARSVEGMALEPLRELVVAGYQAARQAGASWWQGRYGKFRVGIVDGTSFGTFQASVVELVGQSAVLLDLEPIAKRGKELPSSHQLLRRVQQALGTGALTLILGDGLYFNAPFFNVCLEQLHGDVLVKTDDARRELIVDAMGVFQSPPRPDDGILRATGTDVERACTYQLRMASGFEMADVAEPVTVVWIHEEYLKKPRQVDFWLIFTQRYGPGLALEETRQLGHLRWDVENHGFREFNHKLHTKHGYSHKSHAMTVILLLLFVIFTLIQLCLYQVWEPLTTAYPGMKLTRQFVVQELRKTLTPSSPGVPG